MALYRFTESPLCVCTKDDVQAVAQLASDCKDTAQWALYGVACLCVGAIFGAMELSADVVLLGANQLFLRAIKRKSSRCGVGGGRGDFMGGVPQRDDMLPGGVLPHTASCPPPACHAATRLPFFSDLLLLLQVQQPWQRSQG